MDATIFTDSRDGKEYKAIKIGNLTWMAENLNFGAEDSWCYQEREAYGKEYGRLYTWAAAVAACPPGWRLPTGEEWQSLFDLYGGLDACYDLLVEDGTSGLNFTLAGYRDINGKFGRIGAYGGYWTGEETNTERALGVNFDGYYNKVDLSDALKGSSKCCRCVKIE